MSKISFIILSVCLGISVSAQAEQIYSTIYRLTPTGVREEIGVISFEDTPNGLFITQDLANLPAGLHGIHVHEHGNCGSTNVDGKTVLGGAAGGHYDPTHSGKHKGPNADGHKGDLPVLIVQEDGTVQNSFYLTGVSTDDFSGRSIIIHANGDNYRDDPKPLGGGGDRIACGLIP